MKKVVCKTQTSRPPFPPQLTAIKIAAATRQQKQQQQKEEEEEEEEPPSMGERKKAKLLKCHSKFLALGKTKCTRRGSRRTPRQGKARLLLHICIQEFLAAKREYKQRARRERERETETKREGER